MKMAFVKRIFAIVLAFSLSVSLTIPAMAAGITTNEGTISTTNSVQPREVSGWRSERIEGYGEFTITSPGWSLFAHVGIVITGTDPSNIIMVSVIDPKGRVLIPTSAQIFHGNSDFNQNVNNAPAGTYTVKVQTSNGAAIVTVGLYDWYV